MKLQGDRTLQPNISGAPLVCNKLQMPDSNRVFRDKSSAPVTYSPLCKHQWYGWYLTRHTRQIPELDRHKCLKHTLHIPHSLRPDSLAQWHFSCQDIKRNIDCHTAAARPHINTHHTSTQLRRHAVMHHVQSVPTANQCICLLRKHPSSTQLGRLLLRAAMYAGPIAVAQTSEISLPKILALMKSLDTSHLQPRQRSGKYLTLDLYITHPYTEAARAR